MRRIRSHKKVIDDKADKPGEMGCQSYIIIIERFIFSVAASGELGLRAWTSMRGHGKDPYGSLAWTGGYPFHFLVDSPRSWIVMVELNRKSSCDYITFIRRVGCDVEMISMQLRWDSAEMTTGRKFRTLQIYFRDSERSVWSPQQSVRALHGNYDRSPFLCAWRYLGTWGSYDARWDWNGGWRRTGERFGAGAEISIW